MRKLSIKRKYLPLFLGLLLLGLLIGIMIPFASSAAPAGNKISNLYLLEPYANEAVTDNKGNLRFAFSVDSTGYAEYGIVYSNTVQSPVVGEDDCQINNYKINGFQNSMDADHPAISGRKWVLFKIGNIWHTQHDVPYYVRAYVKDSSGKYYYSRDVICTTVCRMFGHAHTVPNPVSTTSAVSLTEPGTRVGHCSVCNRDNKTEYVSPSVTTETFTSSSSGTYVKKTNIYTTLLENGTKHFYPHSSNENKGNDLLIEFSFLWNKSLAGLEKACVGLGRIANSGGGDATNAFNLTFANNVSGMRVPYAGAFARDTYTIRDYGKEGLTISNPTRDQCVFIGEYGWHRIGVRIHEDAWSEKITNNGNDTYVVKYRMTTMLYLDGQPIAQLAKEYDASETDSNMLFTATVSSDGNTLYYTDIPNGRYVYGFRVENRKAKSGKTVEFSYTDYSVTCGREFQKKVEFNYPLYNLNANYPAGVYYKPITHETMPSGDFKLPAVDPTDHTMYLPEHGQHPRLLFTEAELPVIKTTFTQDATGRKQDILNLAESGTSFTIRSNGNSTNTYRDENDVLHHYQLQKKSDIEDVLKRIEAKAFLYQINGTEQYALEAISMMKDLLNRIEDIDDGNKCRVFGEGMFVAALVYDWCYDLFSPSDRTTLIHDVTEKLCKPFVANPSTSPWSNEQFRMEVGFPPSGDQLNEGAISDHGCERQILRDYLSFAIAIFDQDRSWYDYVAGRLYQEYVPVRNYLYESDYAPQGISNYLDMRFGSDIWSAWLLKTATGVLPYDGAHMQNVMHTAYAHYTQTRTAGSTIFSMGDDPTHDEWQHSSGMARLKQLALSGMISGYLFNDPISMRWAKYSGDYAYVHSIYYMILRSSNVNDNAANRFNGLSLITYNGGYLGQMIAHNKWADTDSASVFMKIGCRTTSGHDHADSGSFQIFYKGLLAGDAGVYDSYNSVHWEGYHQATIAHNSIVLMRGSDTTYTVLQQRQQGETRNFNEWLNSDYYKTGEVTGHATGNKNGKPAYAYIAGNIAAAYDSNDITRLDRRMLTVFDTGDPDVPMYFIVFDYVVSKNASDKKAFLLHTRFEPELDPNTHSATITGNDSKLIVQSVSCGSNGANITAVECNASNNYNVGGTTYPTPAGTITDGYWGWLQISPKANEKYTPMLTVMLVADADSDNVTASSSTYQARHFSNTKVQGTAIGNTVAVFVAQADPIAESVGFYTTGVPSGNKNYYVSNVAKGTWIVHSSDGTQTLTTTEEEHFLTFNAPTGTIVLEYVGPNIGQN